MSVLRSINPSTGEVNREVDPISHGELKDRIIAAHEAFHFWRSQSLTHRTERISQLGTILQEKKEDLARIITLEMGKPYRESVAEIEKCAWLCSYYAEHAQEFLSEVSISTDASESYVRYEPLGVILGIMPWNFPFWQVFRFAVPTLAAGNSVLLKHASNVPLCSMEMEKVFVEALGREGIFQSLLIGSDKVGEVLQSPFVKAVSLTGSSDAGRKVAAEAGKNLKKSLLELGGSNAFIVLEDADLNKAVELGIRARFQNTGQSCIAAKRFIILPGIYDAFREEFLGRVKNLKTGNPFSEVDLGPLAREDLAKGVEDQIVRSVEKGARLLTGGTRNGSFISPTVLENVRPGMPAFDEEIFGPVAALIKAKNLEQAIALSNQSSFGLGVSVITKNVSGVKKVLDKFEDGAVFINELVKSDPRLPFGGTKDSGYGRELAKSGILEFVNEKTIYINR